MEEKIQQVQNLVELIRQELQYPAAPAATTMEDAMQELLQLVLVIADRQGYIERRTNKSHGEGGKYVKRLLQEEDNMLEGNRIWSQHLAIFTAFSSRQNLDRI